MQQMDGQQGYVDQLTRLGLTMYEAKAYLALIRRGSSTAAEVARIAGVPRQRIYDVLASLVERGLASTHPGRVVRYVGSAPDTAIAHLVNDRRQAVHDLERAANAMIQQLAPAFKAGQGETDPLDYIKVLRDRRAINESFRELQEEIKDEILVFTKPPYATPPQEEKKGVEVARTHKACSVYEFSIFDDPETIEGVRGFIEAGEEARFVEELPLKLVIIDEKIVMFGMQDPVAEGSELTMVVVEHPSLAQTLKIAFSTVWKVGLTFEQAYDQHVQEPIAKTA
jgi:HTH-type transcriptional regulator, sugar sensing transcriptional regulator